MAVAATIHVKSRIDLNFDVFMIFDLNLFFPIKYVIAKHATQRGRPNEYLV